MPAVPLERALRESAERDPERAAITDGERTFTRREVDELADRAAARLNDTGVRAADPVAVTGANSAELLITFFAIWRLGAVPVPLHPRKGRAALAELVQRSGACVVVGFPPAWAAQWPGVRAVALPALFRAGVVEPIAPGPVSPRLRIGSSGGSTGPAKLISVDVPAIVNPARPWHYAMRPDGTHVVPLDLCDGTAFVATTSALALGCHQVLMRTFEPQELLALIEHHHADWLAATQPVLHGVIKLPADVRTNYDVASLRCVTQYSGAIADWAKRAWIDWLGPDRVAESYGATDSRGSTWISGRQWLHKPGSVGVAADGCEIGIFDAAGLRLGAGELGLVYVRDLTGRRNFHYLGADATVLDGGWEHFGDMGRLDEDDYLYLADRATDMIGTERGLVAPLPIEGAIEFHPAVRSALVIGLPSADGFERVHALVDAPGTDVADTELRELLATRFPEVRRPDTWERCPGPLRDLAGKASRPALRSHRLQPA